jgi:Kef-type K+ transport system membrane component KefB
MELDYLYWLILLLLFGRALGEVFRRFDFQPLIGEVLAGLILGPAVIGLTITSVGGENPLEYFSQFGIIMLMLLAGLITDFESFSTHKISSIIIGAIGVLVSFVLVFFPIRYIFGMDFLSSLFIAAILSNTAIEVSAGILIDSKNQKIKNVVLGASFLDDIIAVFLIGIVSSMVFMGETPNVINITWLGLRVIIFLFVALVVVSKILEKFFDWLHKGTEEYKWMLTTTFILTFAFALSATWVDLHYVIGAYMAGLIIGKWGSKVGPLLRRRITWRKLVEDIDPPLRAIFGPIFFGYIGLSTSIILSEGNADMAQVVPFIIILAALVFLGKILGCGIGARLRKFQGSESFVIGCAMCGRGALGLVLLSFGLEIGVITESQFISLVIVTLITIVGTPILYSLALKRHEKKRKSESNKLVL